MQHFQFYPDLCQTFGGWNRISGIFFLSWYSCQMLGRWKHISGKCVQPNVFHSILIFVQPFAGRPRSQGPRAPRLLVLNILSTNMDSGAILILLGISKVTFQYLTLWVLFINIKYKIHNKIVFLGEFTQNFFLMMFYKKKYNHSTRTQADVLTTFWLFVFLALTGEGFLQYNSKKQTMKGLQHIHPQRRHISVLLLWRR